MVILCYLVDLTSADPSGSPGVRLGTRRHRSAPRPLVDDGTEALGRAALPLPWLHACAPKEGLMNSVMFSAAGASDQIARVRNQIRARPRGAGVLAGDVSGVSTARGAPRPELKASESTAACQTQPALMCYLCRDRAET